MRSLKPDPRLLHSCRTFLLAQILFFRSPSGRTAASKLRRNQYRPTFATIFVIFSSLVGEWSAMRSLKEKFVFCSWCPFLFPVRESAGGPVAESVAVCV